jgi:YesN/AraC family two-component response regulator
MKEEIIYIQNMLTTRDILAVSNALEQLGLKVQEIELGMAAFINTTNQDREALAKALAAIGYRLLQKEEKDFVDQVKLWVEDYLSKRYESAEESLLSDYLEGNMAIPYPRISKRFRKIENRTIENYFIGLKVEKVKSLINTTDLSIKDIASRMKYSGPKSLAKTFKGTTGLSIYHYKKKDHPGYLLAYGT